VKFAYIYDCCVQNSFYIENGIAYEYASKKPYMHIHAITPSLHNAGWNFPFLWGDGSFLNIKEWVENDLDLPDEDFDMIMYANERVGLDNENKKKYGVERLKEKYPNAKVFGWFKELELSVHNIEVRSKNRIDFLKECDGIVAHGITTMKNSPFLLEIEKQLGEKIKNYISCPINIDTFYDNFYSNKKQNSIFAYLPNPIHRRGETYSFAQHMGKKYDIPVRYKSVKGDQEYSHLSAKEFIELWSPSVYHFNLDPSELHPGQQTIQVANVGSINIGGINESHGILYPNTATNDLKILEEKFVEYINDEDKRFQDIEYAWIKLNEFYSYDTIKKQLLEIYNA